MTNQIGVTETPLFIKKASKIFDEAEIEALMQYLKSHPNKGSVIPGMGGIRKMRWAAKGKGKRGGARIIYCYFMSQLHIYLLTCYSKNEQDDLGVNDKKWLKEMAETLKG